MEGGREGGREGGSRAQAHLVVRLFQELNRGGGLMNLQ